MKLPGSKSKDGEFPVVWQLLLRLGGKNYLRFKHTLEEVKKHDKGVKILLLLSQAPLLSAQEEVGLVLQIFGNVV
jgi:hypothetical protein